MSLQWVSEQPKSTFNNNKLNLFLTLYYIITLDWPANWQATQGGPVIVSDVWLLMNLVPFLLVLKLVPIFLAERAKSKGWWKTQVMEKHDTVVEKKIHFLVEHKPFYLSGPHDHFFFFKDPNPMVVSPLWRVLLHLALVGLAHWRVHHHCLEWTTITEVGDWWRNSFDKAGFTQRNVLTSLLLSRCPLICTVVGKIWQLLHEHFLLSQNLHAVFFGKVLVGGGW